VDKPLGTPHRRTHKETQSNPDSPSKHVFIHPQASPIVSRHAIEALIVLSKIFPQYFITSQKTGLVKRPAESSACCFLIENVITGCRDQCFDRFDFNACWLTNIAFCHGNPPHGVKSVENLNGNSEM